MQRPEGCIGVVGGAAPSGGCGGRDLFSLPPSGAADVPHGGIVSVPASEVWPHSSVCFSGKDTCVAFRAYLDNSDDRISKILNHICTDPFPKLGHISSFLGMWWGDHSALHRWLVASYFLWTFKFPLHLTLFCKPVFPPMPGGGLSGDGLYPGTRMLLSYTATSLFVLNVDYIIFKCINFFMVKN